jgi:hypothetical protein
VGVSSADQWGEVIVTGQDTNGNDIKRVQINDADKYTDWMATHHFDGDLHPFVRQRIVNAVNHANAHPDWNLPQDIHNLRLPGTHAEIKAFNDALRQMRDSRAQLTQPAPDKD